MCRGLAAAAALGIAFAGVPGIGLASELDLNLHELESSAAAAKEIIESCRAELPPCTDADARRSVAAQRWRAAAVERDSQAVFQAGVAPLPVGTDADFA